MTQAFGAGTVIVGGYIVAGAATIVAALTSNAYLCAAIGIVFACHAWTDVVSYSLRQELAPDALHGRVFSLFRTALWGVWPLGALAGGLLATWSLRAPLLMFAFISLAIGAIAPRLVGNRTMARGAHDHARLASRSRCRRCCSHERRVSRSASADRPARWSSRRRGAPRVRPGRLRNGECDASMVSGSTPSRHAVTSASHRGCHAVLQARDEAARELGFQNRGRNRPTLRWALLEGTMHALKHPAYSERYQRNRKRLGKQRGAKVAQIDIARRLAHAIWHMLSRNQPFAPRGAAFRLAA